VFTREGRLRHIHRLNYWPLEKVLEEKYKFPRAEARAFADFLMPMLNFVPSKRATAGQMLQHPWLRGEAVAAPAAAAAAPAAPASRRSLERQGKQRSNERSRTRSRSPKRSRSPSPVPHPGYRHHSPAPAPPATGTQQAAKAQPKQQAQSGSSSGASAGTPAPPAVAAVDLTASTVLVTAGGQPPAASPRASAKAGTGAGSARKSCDSNSSGQSWELVGNGEAGTALPASA
jgi:serine/threonine-protein kinase SRPK3